MKHIRYIGNNKPVCEKPDMLGHDFLVMEYGPKNEMSCEPCGQLVTAHNKKQYEMEEMVGVIQRHEDPLAPAHGFFAGLALASIFWFTFVVALYLIVGG